MKPMYIRCTFYPIVFVPGEETDLEFYILEAGEILGISSVFPTNDRNPKRILEYVLAQLFEFKKLGQVTFTTTSYSTQRNYLRITIISLQDADVHEAMLYDVGDVEEGEEEQMFSDLEEYDDL